MIIGAKENFNPLSSKGRLSFFAFAWTLLATFVVNLVIYALIRGALIHARAELDKKSTVIFYVVWFLLATLGFRVTSSCFIKRWSDILAQENIGRPLRALIRFSLLSPLLGFPLALATLLFFPQSPMNDVTDGGSKSGILLFLVGFLALTVGFSCFLPNSWFGLERIQFRESSDAYAPGFNDGKNPFPSEALVKPLLAVATPVLRYLAWVGSDFLRTRMLSQAVGNNAATLCVEKMGFIRVEVQDCYFKNLRKMSTQTPMVSPYFALYFETEYRKAAVKPTADGSAAMAGIANGLLMISNLIELLEPGPIYIERAHLLKPSFLLHAFGSPEFPLVEAGQDIQRLAIVDKLLPIISTQVESIRSIMKSVGQMVGPDEVLVQSELRDIDIRIQAIRKDPLMIGSSKRD